MKASHAIGAYRADGVGHFIPWVRVIDDDHPLPTNGLYTQGFTFKQLYEIEWATQYLQLLATYDNNLDGSADQDISAECNYKQQSVVNAPVVNEINLVRDERDLLRRAGCRAFFNGSTDNGTFEAEIHIAEQEGADFWYPSRKATGPIEDITVTTDVITSLLTPAGARIYFDPDTGLFYPSFVVTIRAFVQDPDDEEKKAQTIYCAADIYGQPDISFSASGQSLTLIGSDWTKIIPLLTSGLIQSLPAAGSGLEAQMTGDAIVDLVPWPYA